jgi:hypothetical protein
MKISNPRLVDASSLWFRKRIFCGLHSLLFLVGMQYRVMWCWGKGRGVVWGRVFLYSSDGYDLVKGQTLGCVYVCVSLICSWERSSVLSRWLFLYMCHISAAPSVVLWEHPPSSMFRVFFACPYGLVTLAYRAGNVRPFCVTCHKGHYNASDTLRWGSAYHSFILLTVDGGSRGSSCVRVLT